MINFPGFLISHAISPYCVYKNCLARIEEKLGLRSMQSGVIRGIQHRSDEEREGVDYKSPSQEVTAAGEIKDQRGGASLPRSQSILNETHSLLAF